MITGKNSTGNLVTIITSAKKYFEPNKPINEEINHVEGDPRDSDWILIDANGVLVHLFTENERVRVNLEELLNKQIKRA